MQETRVRSLRREDPLEKKMANHPSTLAWKIPWTEESSRLQSMGSQRVGHDWATSLSLRRNAGKLAFELLSFERSLYILDTEYLFVKDTPTFVRYLVSNIFPHSVASPQPFPDQKFNIFITLWALSFMNHGFGSKPKNSLPGPCVPKILPIYIYFVKAL